MASPNENVVSKAVKRSYDSNNNEILDPKKSKIEVSPLRLADVNDDCLRLIFEKLSLDDVVNVAEAHERFVPAAESVFSRRYRNQKFMVSSILTQHSCITIEKDVAVRFVRHFGEYVKTLLIDCLSQHTAELEELLVKHCAGSLVNLGLTFTTQNCFKAMNTPFEKVEKLYIDQAILNEKMSQLSICFPNVSSLDLCNVKLLKPNSLEVNFAQLKRLKIHNEKMSIPMATVVEMLRLNPQLEKLRLKQFDYDMDLVQTISKHLQVLEELEIWTPQDRFSSFKEQKIRFDNVKKFTLNTFYCRAEFVAWMPFEFKKLEELHLNGFNQFTNHIMSFILENQNLTELSLIPFMCSYDDLTHEDLLTIVNSLPKLTKLKFCADKFSRGQLVQLLGSSAILKKVQLLFSDLPICQRIRAELQNDWNIRVHFIKIASCTEAHATNFCFCLERKE